jgi:hypothetical protein
MMLPLWLSRRLTALHRTGQLALNNERDLDFHAFQSRDVSRELGLIKHLSIAGTYITSLEGLPVLPNLRSFIADHTGIDSFVNFAAISSATKVSLKGTPLSKERNFKLSLLLVCGPRLTSINGQMITGTIRQRSEQFPPFAAQFINKGWIAETPPPDSEGWRQLALRYSIPIGESEEVPRLEEQEPEFEIEDFEAITTRFRAKQQQLYVDSDCIFATTPPDKDDLLKEELNKLFQSRGKGTEEDEDLLLRHLEEICSQAAGQVLTEFEEENT